MPKKEKNMQFANFNVTFGNENSPMLEYFTNVIYPAFTLGFIREIKYNNTSFSFNNIHIKEYDDYLCLTGNFIKNTNLEIHTIMDNGYLKPQYAEYPTAPYSRFIIFLHNHRMLLVKNEALSPDLRVFQKTISEFINKRVKIMNKDINDKNERIPYAVVNIITIDTKPEIESMFSNIEKIEELRLKFCPLNNDINCEPVLEDINNLIENIGSKNSCLTIKNPRDIKGAQKLVEVSEGIAKYKLKVKNKNGGTQTYQTDKEISQQKIMCDGNISGNNDTQFIEISKKHDFMTKISKENLILYDRIKYKILELFNLGGNDD